MKNKLRIFIGLGGILLLLLAMWRIEAAADGLDITRSQRDGVPITLITPKGALKNDLPLVLIAHGFAGSGVIMRSFAYPLAYAGYAVAVWDFNGHGGNPNPLSSTSSDSLLSNAEAAFAEAQALGIGNPARVAILGHSMGSGVAMTFGQRHAETAATIAVSPVGVTVTPALPHNLLLMAGQNEASFIRNAQARLAEAGGAGGDPQKGTARALHVIPLVEHITIVFSPVAHTLARQWLDATFGPQPGAVTYSDRRILWYGLGVLGTLLAALALIPATAPAAGIPASLPRRLAALLAGALGATGLLWLLEQAGLSLERSFGLLVGGYLLVWFAVAGSLALLLLISSWSNLKQSLSGLAFPGWRGAVCGLLGAATLWLGVGLLGGEVWLPWMLIPPRLVLWPLGAVLMLPWFLAVGQASSPATGWGRLGWWLAQSLCMLGSLFLALRISQGLFFLLLILPVFPIILGAHAVTAGRQRSPWAFGLSAALFVSWAVLAVFPLQ